MKATGNNQINVKTYWDGIYADPSKDNDYWGWSEAFKNIRFTKAMEIIQNGDKFLDIGCGHGTFARGVKDTHPDCEVWGCDIAKETVKRAQKVHTDLKLIPEEVGRLESIPSNYFDTIFSGEVLEHMTDPNDLLKDAYRLLKKGGKFIITTPLENTIVSPEHMWYFTVDDVSDLYINNGFDKVDFIRLPDMEHMHIIFAVGYK